MKEFIIGKNDAGQRLDRFISKGRVQDLTNSLNTTNKIIKKYVNNRPACFIEQMERALERMR